MFRIRAKEAHMRQTVLAAFVAAAVAATGGAARAAGQDKQDKQDNKDKKLDIYWIDVEGGAATLIVTPSGQSVLVDAGNPGGRDPQRIHKVATEVAGLKQIDHLVVTHLHRDHYGGVAELAGLMPVKTLYENGIESAPEQEQKNEAIPAFRAAKVGKRVAIKVGQKIPVDGITLVVRGARKEFDHGGKGRKNPACGGGKAKEEDKSDNANSVVLSLEYKGFRFFDGGDLTWNMEEKLACPTTTLPEVDVFQSTHHGLDQSNNPVLVRALHPRVAVFNNGPRKGCQPESFATVKGLPGLEAIYQVHKNLVAADANTTPEKIANVDEKCAGNYLKLSVDGDGKKYTVSNPSTGHQQTFKTKS
jgi:beta-lactamase superfamily II metal-dependent hydrolase